MFDKAMPFIMMFLVTILFILLYYSLVFLKSNKEEDYE